ncbi:MAG TPA: SDR family oxidoreductase [Balneolaceae bacterium]|nr:SDR family oxidoreductase [Balneolaceae bacterium]
MAKSALVTGASRGIGRETSISLARKGHRVIAVARSEDQLKALQQQYSQHISYITADLTEDSDLINLKERLSQKNTELDILINNAGALINKPFQKLTTSEWQFLFNANVMTVVNTVKTVLPIMNKNSHIVNISSMGGFQGSSKFTGLTAYSVTKGAVSILTECLATELADLNVSVNALCLGSVDTEMFDQAFPGFEADVQAGDMGAYIADFALNKAAFFNGKILPVALSDPS